MDDTYKILRARCARLILDLGLEKHHQHFTLPLSRYIMAIPYAIPVNTIILGERPYRTDIFPYVAPAMAYRKECEVTPSVHFLAMDISNSSDIEYKEALEWFRDSWKYLRDGICILNVCTLYKFIDVHSERERVVLEEFIRDIIEVSLRVSYTTVRIYAMGKPAQHSANRIRSSIGNYRPKNSPAISTVVVHSCDNPASLIHREGDKWSPDITLKSPVVSRRLAGLIRSTRDSLVLTEADYLEMASNPGSDHSRLVSASQKLGDSFELIEKYFKENTGAQIERNEELFGRAAKEMKEFIIALQSARVQAIFAGVGEPSGTTKPAYISHRQSYNPTRYSRGGSTRVPSVASSTQAANIGILEPDYGSSSEEEKSNKNSTPEKETVKSKAPSTDLMPPPKRSSTRSRTSGTFSSASSAPSRRTSSVAINIISEEESDSGPSDTPKVATISIEEANDMSYVTDFLENSGAHDLDNAVIEFISENSRMKVATYDIVKDLLKVIRTTHKDPSQMSIMDALGYGDTGIVDMSSDIIQWINRNCLKSS